MFPKNVRCNIKIIVRAEKLCGKLLRRPLILFKLFGTLI